MKPIHVRIPDSHHARLEELAVAADRDFSWIVRKAVRQYLETAAETSRDTPEHAVTQRVLGIAS